MSGPQTTTTNTRCIGHYELRETLGQGMSGKVKKGVHRNTGAMVALKIIDRAIQIHGGEGVSQLTPLASMYAHMRTLRLADGPDEVHRRAVARHELGKYMA